MVLVSRESASGGSGAEPLSHDAGDEDWLSRLAQSSLVRGDVVALARELPERAPQLVARALELHGWSCSWWR
ncbi:MAG TPA: hypothetical protein VFS67_19910 [Polyangiaceae bacterium]|nr:hypothetical protein [Polyangiaceae bacterium]